MKKILAFLFCWSIMAVCADAQDGPSTIFSLNSEDNPVTSKGKAWIVRYQYADAGGRGLAFNMATRDSVINGVPYVPVTVSERTFSTYYSVLRIAETPTGNVDFFFRQEGDKVYCLPEGCEKEYLVLDYGMRKGESFESASGEIFYVLETGYFDEYTTCLYHSSGSRPRMLRLRSEETGKEETWIEGMGAVEWGIVPVSILLENKVLEEIPSETHVFRVSNFAGQVYVALFPVNEDDYKAAYYVPGDERESKDMGMEYSFQGDTLCISGVYLPSSSYGHECVECVVTDGNLLALTFYGLHIVTTNTQYREFEVRLPGFEPGKYYVYNKSDIPEELVCKPTTGVKAIDAERLMIDNDAPTYDLSGRRISVSSALPKGVYIRNGRKQVRL